jgi:hypothetical protein
MRARLAVAFGTLLVACHTYVPLTTPTPLPGTYVAATLTESGSTALSGSLGPDAGVVRGRLLDDGRQGMMVSIRSVGLRRGDELAWSGETVNLPRASIARVDERRLSKVRSVLMLAVGAAGFVALTRSFDLHVRGTGGVLAPNGPGPPSQ